MSCPAGRDSIHVKPKRTQYMKKKNYDYVWKEIDGNPNLYCWVPVSKKGLYPADLDIQDVNIQDIPPPPTAENYDDIIANISEQAIHQKQLDSLKRLDRDKSPQSLVSVDDPEKYPIVKDFIRKKGLKVYGGVAINSYLPKEAKFYNAYDIPDYDVYSPDPWNDAVELADIFHANGYKYSEAKAGIHKGTYKVFVNLWPVADISYMPPEEFDKIPTKTINGVKVISPFKILESMYKEFSEPYANPARWPKVASREKLIQKWVNPLNKKFRCSKDLFSGGEKQVNSTKTVLLEESYRFIRDKDLIFTGPIAYNTYIEVGGGSRRVLADYFRVLSEFAQDDVQELLTRLLRIYPHLEVTTRYFPSRELNNTSYSIFAVIEDKHELVTEIIHLTSCTPHHKVLGRNVVGIDYLLYDLYDTTVFGDTEKSVSDAKCKLQYLTKIQNRYYAKKGILETDKSPFQRFMVKCRGPFQENNKVVILNRWLEKLENKKKIVKDHDKDFKILKIPKDKIPQECRDKDEATCKYPCFWNKYVGRCTGIPTGTYHPGEEIEEEFM